MSRENLIRFIKTQRVDLSFILYLCYTCVTFLSHLYYMSIWRFVKTRRVYFLPHLPPPIYSSWLFAFHLKWPSSSLSPGRLWNNCIPFNWAWTSFEKFATLFCNATLLSYHVILFLPHDDQFGIFLCKILVYCDTLSVYLIYWRNFKQKPCTWT